MGNLEDDGFEDLSLMTKPCVYLLTLKGVVVYVGQSRFPLRRLATHLEALNKQVKKRQWRRGSVDGIVFDGLWIKRVGFHVIDEVEKEYIKKFMPQHNIKHNPRPTTPMDLNALIATLISTPAPPPVTQPRIHRRF